MALSVDYRRMLRKEMKAYTTIQKSFNKQRKFLEANVEYLYENYVVSIGMEYNYLNNAYVHLYPLEKKGWEQEYNDEPLAGFWRAMGIEEMFEYLGPIIARSYEKGYKLSYRMYKEALEKNGLIYSSTAPSDYALKRGELNLSNYKGAISYTTKMDVINILKNGIDNHLSGGEVKKQIMELDENLFGKARARAIAVTETHKAYEYGNLQPMKELQNVGVQVKKKWLTVGDERVRPEHMDCERLEWVNLDYVYPSVGVDIPPGGVNCRCTMLYHID